MPMSSPSRSKSVAMYTSDDSEARDLRVDAIAFSDTTFTGSASMRTAGSVVPQLR